MSSLRTLFLGIAFVMMALFQLASASPVGAEVAYVRPPPPGKGDTTCIIPLKVATSASAPASSITSLTSVIGVTASSSSVISSLAISTTTVAAVTPSLPLSGDATELPQPPNGQTLQYIALGRGVQNYTCANSSAVPFAVGAIATLFDGTSVAEANATMFEALPAQAVYLTLPSLPPAVSNLPVLGNHFFAADGTPTFNLTGPGKILYGVKTDSIAAPASADPGPAGTGAVAWLYLPSKTGVAAENSVGVQTVYRVSTAGGNPPSTCSGAGTISVQYSALYWFYG